MFIDGLPKSPLQQSTLQKLKYLKKEEDIATAKGSCSQNRMRQLQKAQRYAGDRIIEERSLLASG